MPPASRSQQAHRLAIPLENRDLALGRPSSIERAAVAAKLMTMRHGGYCFEPGQLFLDALHALGFVAGINISADEVARLGLFG